MGRNIRRGSIPVRACLNHLRRRPIPEIMDDDCVAALKNLETQYGGSATTGYGLEVRLGEEARYVDFILKTYVKNVPLIDSHWIEIDYEQFAGKKPISACYFAKVAPDESGDYQTFLNKSMPTYVGEEYARSFHSALERILTALPPGANIKLVGYMESRGREAALRLVLNYPDFSAGAANLPALGWPGDTAALQQAFAPWVEAGFTFGFAVDVFPDHIGEKLGLETYWSEMDLQAYDSVIDRLERAGLCLPSKAAALRRWCRFPPCADPDLYTRISYIKLNYLQGRITEAKAYLEASSVHSNIEYPAFERPLRIDLEVSDGRGNSRTDDEVLDLILECGSEGVWGLRFYGCEGRASLPQWISAAQEGGFYTEVVLQDQDPGPWLRETAAAKPKAFIIDAGASRALKALRELGVGQGHESALLVRWYMTRENAETLPQVIKEMNALGVSELLITGMTPRGEGNPPTQAQMKAAAKQIWDWRFMRAEEENIWDWGSKGDRPSEPALSITIDKCFPVMHSMMGANALSIKVRCGFEIGCEGGRSSVFARADGTFSPCGFLPGEAAASLSAYWERSPALLAHRKAKHPTDFCASCDYAFRCVPCPVFMSRTPVCPLQP